MPKVRKLRAGHLRAPQFPAAVWFLRYGNVLIIQGTIKRHDRQLLFALVTHCFNLFQSHIMAHTLHKRVGNDKVHFEIAVQLQIPHFHL